MAYGLLGAPLAMAALPVYVHTPRLYGDEFGLGLALTGAILLFSRAIDTLQDPWLGRLADRLQHKAGGWVWLFSVAAVFLCLAYAALLNPPMRDQFGLSVWFIVSLVLVYTAHSALNIAYLAWGAKLSEDTHERTRLVAFREGFGLSGVILASLLPMLLLEWVGQDRQWLLFSLLFSALLVVSVWTLLRNVPFPSPGNLTRSSLFKPLQNKQFRRLSSLFLLNGLAVATAATLSVFYIADVLKLEAHTGYFLAAYFLSGALSLPFWLYLSRRVGKVMAWFIGSLLAISAFVWAVQLGAGDMLPYLVICLMSGIALGADLALPAAIAADLIPRRERGATGSYFGIWSLINKAVLAIAAGVSLPLLAGLGYQPGSSDGLFALAIVYAGVPSLIKTLSAALLVRWQASLEPVHVNQSPVT